ncbi:hypothetical protein IAD21_04112 [Abditibacteriota bacterium]|nr:hypothetical protein IAD21_04112 [Abditibacteriota bacterium]
MCWACYTPLTAGAGAAMGAGVGMGGAGAATLPRAGGPMGVPGAIDDGGGKKEIDPKLFFVGGGLLLALIIGLFTTGAIGGGGGVSGDPEATPFDPPPMNPGGIPPGPGVGPIQQASVPSQPTNTGGQVVPPPGPAYTVIVSPNPKYATAAFAIAPSTPGVSSQQALNLARQARQSMAANGKWTKYQIAVFTTSDSAQSFKQYMNQRRGAPLTGGDYAMLAGQNAWASCTVFYDTGGGKERTTYPSQNPKAWWGGR